jgi:Tol biopolymer transport system component
MKIFVQKTVLTVALTVYTLLVSWAQSPEQLFQKGLMKEEGEGSLKEAIELYKSVADNNSADRALRAKALFQMGNCYEKLGQQEARKVYEKLVANYTEQTELVANAKRKLDQLYVNDSGTKTTGITINQMKFENNSPVVPSPDGKYAFSEDGGNFPAIEMNELKTGKKWRISDKGDYTKYPLLYPFGGVVFSPDSKQVAYGWSIERFEGKKFILQTEIHLVNVDGSENRVIVSDTIFNSITDWSRDGKYLLGYKSTHLKFRQDVNEKNVLYIISTRDKSEKIISDLGNRKIGSATFTNDGKFVVFNAQAEFKSENYDIYSVPVNGGTPTPVITNREYDSGPVRVPGTNSMVYLSNHSGFNDLWEMTLSNGILERPPVVLKNNMDISTELKGIKNNGAIYYSTLKLYPSEIYSARMDLDNKNLQFIPLNVERTAGKTIRRVLWSPSMNKVACFLQGGKILNDQAFKTPIDLIIKDMKTGVETRIKNDLKFHLENIFNRYGWWTPGDTSILIWATDPDNMEGLYEINVENGEYALVCTWSKMPGNLWDIRFSPDGEPLGYYYYDNKETKTNGVLEKSMKTEVKRLLLKSDHPISNTVLSPDGKKMAYSIDSMLYIVDVNNDEDFITVGPLKKNSWPIGWTADNQSLFIKKYNEEKKGMEIWLQSVNDKSLNLLYTTEQLEDFRYVRKINIQHAGDSSYITMTMGSYLGEWWEMDNLFTSGDLTKK